MVDFADYDRPNTVAGLVAKHREFSALREIYVAEIKKLTVDIDHLDAAIRLFDPAADTSAIKEYVTKRPKGFGQALHPDDVPGSLGASHVATDH